MWPEDTTRDMIQRMMGQSPGPQPLELIKCANCWKVYSWNSIRKILDDKGAFVQYRCINCVTEGAKID